MPDENRKALFEGLSPRVSKLLVLTVVVWAVAIVAVLGRGFLGIGTLLPVKGSTFIKVVFCALQVPMALTLVAAVSDYRQGKVTRKGLVATCAMLVVLWPCSFFFLAKGANMANYGF